MGCLGGVKSACLGGVTVPFLYRKLGDISVSLLRQGFGDSSILNIRTSSGDDIDPIFIQYMSTVRELKAEIARRRGLEQEQIVLLKGDQELADGQILNGGAFANQDEITLVIQQSSQHS